MLELYQAIQCKKNKQSEDQDLITSFEKRLVSAFILPVGPNDTDHKANEKY
jgi:hypothetical protein